MAKFLLNIINISNYVAKNRMTYINYKQIKVLNRKNKIL